MVNRAWEQLYNMPGLSFHWTDVLNELRRIPSVEISLFHAREPGGRRTHAHVRVHIPLARHRKLYFLQILRGSWVLHLVSGREFVFANDAGLIRFIRECSGPYWPNIDADLPKELLELCGLKQIN